MIGSLADRSNQHLINIEERFPCGPLLVPCLVDIHCVSRYEARPIRTIVFRDMKPGPSARIACRFVCFRATLVRTRAAAIYGAQPIRTIMLRAAGTSVQSSFSLGVLRSLAYLHNCSLRYRAWPICTILFELRFPLRTVTRTLFGGHTLNLAP